MVRPSILSLLCLIAAPAEACRLALVLALDVSSSVDEAEDSLQRNGVANALRTTAVQDAFLASPDPVALTVFEWSGRGHQTTLAPWTMITTADDLNAVANTLSQTQRGASGLPTAMGHALAYAAVSLQNAPRCLFQTIDMAGDGANNSGFGPGAVYATFPVEDVTVNGLVISGAAADAIAYYENEVIKGPLAFVEIADGYTRFEETMVRKLIREVSAQVIGRANAISEARG